jgi:hypothetical protein
MEKEEVKELLKTAGELDDFVYSLQGTKWEYILTDADYDYDEIVYTIQSL